MTEEQIFKSRFPEYCAGEVCLSPYFDFFQIGFEQGENQNKELQEENARLRRYHNCEECEAFGRFCPQKPKREDYESENQYLIDLECGVWNCKNAIKLLVKENERLKKDSEETQDLANIAYMQGASKYKTKLDEAKTIIQDLLSNSDEYARQRVMDWLKEE